MDNECNARCVEVDCKRQRSMLAKLRRGTAELRIETALFSLGTILPDSVEDTSHRVLWNSRAWRKISWRYSLFRCLYPCRGGRLECPLHFVRFSSCLKLSMASIRVAHNGYAKGGHFVYFALWHKLTLWPTYTIDIDKLAVHANVGLAQARPNKGYSVSTLKNFTGP